MQFRVLMMMIFKLPLFAMATKPEIWNLVSKFSSSNVDPKILRDPIPLFCTISPPKPKLVVFIRQTLF